MRPGSEFSVGNGLHFRIDSIRWVTINKVKVEGGYYEGMLSSSGNIYTVVKRGTGWKVKKDEMEWISNKPRYYHLNVG